MQVALWLAADQRVGVPELHRRQLLLRAGRLDNPEPTALSALVVHGLHDSPKAMTNLAEVVTNQSVRGSQLGFNWSSQRLCALPGVPGRVPRQVFASQASCAACR
jgi:hypothetical protein